MKTKKIIAGVTILLALTTSVFAAKAKKSDKIKVVTTIFPEYDWAREIIGDNASNVELTLLLGNGVDLHSYQPSIQDIAKISTADIFIYVGGESDGWVKDALKNAKNKNMKVINLLETLGDKVKAEEVKEGMQAEEKEDEEHHHDGEHHDDEDDKDLVLGDKEGGRSFMDRCRDLFHTVCSGILLHDGACHKSGKRQRESGNDRNDD